MELFSDYFYHDVMIKSILYNLSEDDGTNSISFVLDNSGFDSDGDTESNNDECFNNKKCVFVNIYQSSINLYQNIVGGFFIQLSEINDTDSFLIDYKNRMKNVLPVVILDKLKCYSIYTTGGTIKIISENDVIVLEG